MGGFLNTQLLCDSVYPASSKVAVTTGSLALVWKSTTQSLSSFPRSESLWITESLPCDGAVLSCALHRAEGEKTEAVPLDMQTEEHSSEVCN